MRQIQIDENIESAINSVLNERLSVDINEKLNAVLASGEIDETDAETLITELSSKPFMSKQRGCVIKALRG